MSESIPMQISKAVNSVIMRLQSAYLNGSHDARMTLAMLRKLDEPGGPSWIALGDVIANLPSMPPGYDRNCMMTSVKMALKLYALHQQSQSFPMATTKHVSMGSACHAITATHENANGTGAAGVLRRIATVEAAPDVSGMEQPLRSLVRQMRTANVQLNYGMLARDLYLIQHDQTHNKVFMDWAIAYYQPAQDKAKS